MIDDGGLVEGRYDAVVTARVRALLDVLDADAADDAVPQVVLDEVARLNPSRIVVLGGALAISDEVAAQVQAQTAHRVN